MGWQQLVAAAFQAGNVIMNAAGWFVYSGSPASGNLIASSSDANNDGLGNTVIPGLTSYAPGTPTFAMNLSAAGQLICYTMPTHSGTPTTVGLLEWNSNGDFTVISNSGGNIQINASGIFLNAVVGNVVTITNQLKLLSIISSFTATSGTATSPTLITTDTPNSMSLLNGWTSTGRHAQYILNADGTVTLDFELNVGTVTNGTTIWQAPTGYIPTASVPGTQRFPMIVIAGATGSQLDTPQYLMTTTGALQVSFVPAGTTVAGGNIRYRIN